MSINNVNDINAYIVNELFGKSSSNTLNANSIVDTLQTLGEKYAEISAFGKKLNDIYTTLSQSGDVNQNALEGARNVILSFVNSSDSSLGWMETVNNMDSLKNNPTLFQKFFETANDVYAKGLDLQSWLKAFNGSATYGFASDFINQTSEILSSNNSQLTSKTFQSFVDTLNNIFSSAVNEGMTRQSLSTFFSGLDSASTLEQKNEFITTFEAG